MCDKDKALLAVVNLVAQGTPAAKGNACYLLANLLELGEEIMMRLVAIKGALMAVVNPTSTLTLHPKPSTQNPKPYTQNPKP